MSMAPEEEQPFSLIVDGWLFEAWRRQGLIIFSLLVNEFMQWDKFESALRRELLWNHIAYMDIFWFYYYI